MSESVNPIPPPLPDRVMRIVRAQPVGVSREEVEAALPDVEPKEIRAALSGLRRGRLLEAVLDGSDLVYRAPELRPSSVEGSSLQSRVIRRREKTATAPIVAQPAAIPTNQSQQEIVMPKGVYPRKNKPAATPESSTRSSRKKRSARRAAPRPLGGASTPTSSIGSLEIFADGSIQLRAAAADVVRLLEVVSSLGGARVGA